MTSKEDLKVGQYVKNIYRSYVEYIVSINSQYAYTNKSNRIYPKDYYDYIVLTNEEVKAYSVHYLNEEIKDLLDNLNDLKNEVYNLPNLPYFTIDTDEIETDLDDIVRKINEVLEEFYDK